MTQTAIARLLNAPSIAFRLVVCCAALAFLSAPSLSTSLDGTNSAATFELAHEIANFTVQGDALLDEDAQSAQARNKAIPLAALLSDRVAPFRSIEAGSASYATALSCLTEAIYYEAATESVAGQRGVAQVILNRVAHPAYPSSVCGVIYQGSTAPVCQFSYTCDGSLARPPVARLWRQAQGVAEAALAGHVEQSVGTATHYHADYVLPYWAFRLEKVNVEGRHIFYRFPGRAGRAASFTARWLGREFRPDFDPARFAALLDEEVISEEQQLTTYLERDPTDRRAENDVGGRMDPSSGWQLAIPDPTSASSGYRSALAEQGGDLSSASPAAQTGGDRP